MNIKYILLVALSVLVITVPVFATNLDGEVVEVPSETISEPSENVSEEQTNQEDFSSESNSEPSEGFLEGSDSDYPVVNVSEESINAIALSVNLSYQYTYQYEFTLSNDKEVVIDTDIPNLLDYHIVFCDTYPDRLLISESDIYVDSSNMYRAESGYSISSGFSYIKTGTLISFSDFDSAVLTSNAFGNGWNNPISFAPSVAISASVPEFSNKHIYNASGDLYYKSPVVAFTVTFNSGFDDLVIDSQYSNNFSLPVPVKEGYIFQGWYLDSDYNDLYSTGYQFIEDTTLYAKWSEEPPAGIIAQSIFGSISAMLSCEPMLYILSLMGLLIIILCGKRIIGSRL